MSMLRAMQNNRSREPLTLAQRAICVAAFSTLLAACATRLDNAPVVDRSGSLGTTGAAQPGGGAPPPPPRPPDRWPAARRTPLGAFSAAPW